LRVKKKNKGIDMHKSKRLLLGLFIFCLALLIFLPLLARGSELSLPVEKAHQVSDHFDGHVFFNPGFPQPPPSLPGNPLNRSVFWYTWR
jgi:hypothetical protein